MHESRQMRFQVPIPRPDASVRLFCFPHAGGAAASYVGWSRALENQSIEIVAAQLPGRSGLAGDAPRDDLELIVDAFADAMAPMLDRPFALFGHSLGALVAFELARALRDRDATAPIHLFVSGAFAPQLPADSAPLRSIEGDAAFLEAVAAKYGGVPRIVLEQADLRASMVPALRADLALTETYTYRHAPPLPCPISAYAGASDPIVTPERLAEWREQTCAEFSCRLFDGHHFYLNRARDPLLADVTSRLFRRV
jgi:surfactin synthase thioesterase subunit